MSLFAYRLSGLPTRGSTRCSPSAAWCWRGGRAFTPSAMLLLALYSGLMKLVAVVFEGRLQHLIPSDQRATIGSVKGFLAQIGLIALYLGFGPLAQATSYRMAFMACGVAGIAIGLGYLTVPQLRRANAG